MERDEKKLGDYSQQAYQKAVERFLKKAPRFWLEPIPLLTKAVQAVSDQELLYLAAAFNPFGIKVTNPDPTSFTGPIIADVKRKIEAKVYPDESGSATYTFEPEAPDDAYARDWMEAWCESGLKDVKECCAVVRSIMTGLVSRQELFESGKLDRLNVLIRKYAKMQEITIINWSARPETFAEIYITDSFWVLPRIVFPTLCTTLINDLRTLLLSNSSQNVGECAVCHHPYARTAARPWQASCSHRCADTLATRKRKAKKTAVSH